MGEGGTYHRLMPDLLEPELASDVHTRPEPVAPWWHTVFVLAVLALWAVYGALRWQWPAAVLPHAVTYISSIVVQCLLVGTTIAGLYQRRQFVRSVLGVGRAGRIVPDLLKGCLVFASAWAMMAIVGAALRPLHLHQASGVVRALAPHSAPELALWMLVSLSAGLGEEFVFRGYLLRQFTRWSGSAAVAVVGTAVLFGCMHFYEGATGVVLITVLGAVYATVAVRRGDLRTVMVAHFLQDAVTGWMIYMRHQG